MDKSVGSVTRPPPRGHHTADLLIYGRMLVCSVQAGNVRGRTSASSRRAVSVAKQREDSTLSVTPEYGIAPPGSRLPAGTRVGTVRLQVGDLARSLAWYRQVLGLEVLARDESMVGFGAPGSGERLLELHERPGAAPMGRRGRLGLYHFAVLLPDRTALGRFVRHLAQIGERAGMSDHFVSEAIYLTDPDGLGVEVYADRPRSAWRVEDREIAMTTVPLDVADLTRNSGETPWGGVPAGTIMGHVHLYVGNLDVAADFYHAGLG